MGSSDCDVHVSVVTINHAERERESDSASSGHRMRSCFHGWKIDGDCEVSWSALQLPKGEGWYDLANGSLFVRSIEPFVPFDPFDPVVEVRDDIYSNGDDLVYQNGYRLGKDTTGGIYHLILPPYSHPKEIRYDGSGETDMIYARLMDSRVIYTWHYSERIQLRVEMSKVGIYGFAKGMDRMRLFEIAFANLPNHERAELIRQAKLLGMKEMISRIPRMIAVAGRYVWSLGA